MWFDGGGDYRVLKDDWCWQMLCVHLQTKASISQDEHVSIVNNLFSTTSIWRKYYIKTTYKVL